MGFDQALLHVRILDGRDRAAHGENTLEFFVGCLFQVLDFGFDHMRTIEEILVLQKIRLEGQDLLHAQGPLLIPRPRQAKRLVPCRELERATAGLLGEGDAQRLEHDPDGIVLGLGFGQAQAVDLNAVTEPAQLRVLDAVAVAPQLIPHLRHRTALADLFDEADSGIQEEGDACEHVGEHVVGYVTSRLDRVENGDRVGHGIRDLLDRRRPRFLQVIRADVDRIPLGNLRHGVRHHVADQAHGRLGREHVGAAREIFLDQIILRRAAQLRSIHALSFRRRDVQRQEPGRCRVDRHRRVHLIQGDLLEKDLHVVDMADRHTDFSNLAAGQDMVRVIARLGGKVEGDREPVWPFVRFVR